jgi:predicted transcriptional regulator
MAKGLTTPVVHHLVRVFEPESNRRQMLKTGKGKPIKLFSLKVSVSLKILGKEVEEVILYFF